jgi:Flp pilus assembly protein TadD
MSNDTAARLPQACPIRTHGFLTDADAAGYWRRKALMGTQTTERNTKERLQNAIALKVDGRYDEAEAILRDILEEAPDDPQTRREFALVLGFTGRFDESIEELRRVVEADGSFLEARNDLAMSYAMLGMIDEARKEFETVLEIDPANAMALRQIVYFQ